MATALVCGAGSGGGDLVRGDRCGAGGGCGDGHGGGDGGGRSDADGRGTTPGGKCQWCWSRWRPSDSDQTFAAADFELS